jgi:hypothetical protein
MNSRLWKFLSSLKVTVVLLLLSTLLVFLGTLAQVNEGLWEAQERWFKSYFVLRRAGDAWWVPAVFPGGYSLGFSLLFNLIAAHIQRFQWTAKKVGIHLTHAGIVLRGHTDEAQADAIGGIPPAEATHHGAKRKIGRLILVAAKHGTFGF